MMKYEKELETLKNYALEIGADRAIIIPTDQLVVRHGAWAKCFIPGCKFYGSSIMCPPHNPLTPDITRSIVAEYKWGLLFQLNARVDDFVGDEWRKRHVATELKHKEMAAKLEGKAFYMGFPLAMGFAAGECSLCLPEKPCAVLAGDPCRHPLRARPAMEACGFDVFTIAKKVGWDLVPIGHTSTRDEIPCASLIGLILVVQGDGETMRSLDEYWGMKTLILGDVNSGKTQITLALLTQIITERGAEVAVFDLAPEKTRGIGGKMGVPPHAQVFYYTTTVIPPRLTGRGNVQVDAYARRNAKAIDGLFSSYLKSPKPVLVINDASLYLQAGDLNRLLEVLAPSHTAIVNGYYGTSLGRGSFSRREREQMDRLATVCDRVIHL